MPLRRREPNCGPPTLRLLQTTEGERETYKESVETRQLAGEKSDLVNKHKNISICKRNRFRETMNTIIVSCTKIRKEHSINNTSVLRHTGQLKQTRDCITYEQLNHT